MSEIAVLSDTSFREVQFFIFLCGDEATADELRGQTLEELLHGAIARALTRPLCIDLSCF